MRRCCGGCRHGRSQPWGYAWQLGGAAGKGVALIADCYRACLFAPPLIPLATLW